MLLFAMFTMGYIIGVLITLKFVMDKDTQDNIVPINNTQPVIGASPLEVFASLTKINHQKQASRNKGFFRSLFGKTQSKVRVSPL